MDDANNHYIAQTGNWHQSGVQPHHRHNASSCCVGSVDDKYVVCESNDEKHDDPNHDDDGQQV
jgi:hypothetical protein